jgi:raffinose/stachyose/melibiose transport system permease protein
MNRAIKNRVLAIQVVLSLLAVIWMYPITLSLFQSFKIDGINNYIEVLKNPNINYLRVLFNSMFISVSVTLLVLILTSLAGFAISKMNFRFKDVVYYSLLACLSLPPIAIISPIFFTVKQLGLMDTYAAVILPIVAFQAPFILLLVKNYFDHIPDSLLEAAVIDGSSTFRALFVVIIPLGMPVIINGAVLTFIGAWNEFLLPLLFVRDNDMFTIPLTTNFYLSTMNQTPKMVAQMYASLILMTIPSIIIYVISQKHLHAGLTAGAVKG